MPIFSYLLMELERNPGPFPRPRGGRIASQRQVPRQTATRGNKSKVLVRSIELRVHSVKNVSYEGAPHDGPSSLNPNFFLTKFNFFQYQNRIYIVMFTSSDGSKEFCVAGRIRGQGGWENECGR